MLAVWPSITEGFPTARTQVEIYSMKNCQILVECLWLVSAKRWNAVFSDLPQTFHRYLVLGCLWNLIFFVIYSVFKNSNVNFYSSEMFTKNKSEMNKMSALCPWKLICTLSSYVFKTFWVRSFSFGSFNVLNFILQYRLKSYAHWHAWTARAEHVQCPWEARDETMRFTNEACAVHERET